MVDVSDEALEATLIRLGALMSDCRDPWCVFGGTAMFLHGYRGTRPADIDVLVSPGDGERIMRIAGEPNVADGGTARFRSHLLLHPPLGDIPVEILADFQIFAGSSWREVHVGQRIEVRFGAATTFIASLADIGTIFRLSGRPKDLERLALIETKIA